MSNREEMSLDIVLQLNSFIPDFNIDSKEIILIVSLPYICTLGGQLK